MISQTLFLLIRLTYISIDCGCIVLSILGASWLRQGAFPISFWELVQDPTHPFKVVFVLWTVVPLFFNGLHHLYHTRREVDEAHEIGQVLRSVFFSAITVMALVYSMKIVGFPRSVFVLIVVFTAILFIIWRLLKRVFVEFLAANGYNNFNVLIVGAGRTGMMLAQEIKRHPGFGLKIVGFLDDYKKSVEPGHDHKVLGKLADLGEVCRKNFVHKIFFTIHPPGNIFHDMFEISKDLGLAVRVVPVAFDRAVGEIFKFNIGYIPVLEYSDLRHSRRQNGKRSFDTLVSGFALIFLLPLFVLIGALIKLDSRGPVFYFSRRYGRGGRVFKMWKFRSMVADADSRLNELKAKNEVDGPIFKIRKDPRITRLGAFLRKYSIDELPQILNVFLGDMSLVGPRPFPLDQVQQEDLRQLKRLEVRPGLTGLWQVRGRSDLPFHRLIKWDTWYINNWSFGLDINILLETVPVVLKGKGAY